MNPDCFRPLAGPFTDGETWMIGNIVTDLRRGGIPCEVRVLPNGEREVWRSIAGWQEVVDIEAEEVRP